MAGMLKIVYVGTSTLHHSRNAPFKGLPFIDLNGPFYHSTTPISLPLSPSTITTRDHLILTNHEAAYSGQSQSPLYWPMIRQVRISKFSIKRPQLRPDYSFIVIQHSVSEILSPTFGRQHSVIKSPRFISSVACIGLLYSSLASRSDNERVDWSELHCSQPATDHPLCCHRPGFSRAPQCAHPALADDASKRQSADATSAIYSQQNSCTTCQINTLYVLYWDFFYFYSIPHCLETCPCLLILLFISVLFKALYV